MKIHFFFFFFLLFILLSAYSYAGSEVKQENIEQITFELYKEPVDLTYLEKSISRALEGGIPYDNVKGFVSTSAKTGRKPEEVSYYLDMILDIHSKGVPSGIIINTILEGIAKDMSEERIRDSLSLTKTKLLFCNGIALTHVRKRTRGETVSLLVASLFNALNSGFSKTDLENISSAITERNKSANYLFNAVNIMMELNSLGFREENIIELISVSIANNFTTHDISKYPDILSESFKNGVVDEDALVSLIASIEKGYRPSDSEQGQGKTGGTSSESSGGHQGGSKPGPKSRPQKGKP